MTDESQEIILPSRKGVKKPTGRKGRNANFIQGVFKPKHPEKYRGRAAPIYRSSYELAFMRFCDNTAIILEWSSENNVVPYISPLDGKQHAYFVDNWVKMKTSKGIKKYLVEIKPKKQTLPPPVPTAKRKASSILYEHQTYAVNKAKWAAAEKYAKALGMEFQILTEEHLMPHLNK